MSLWTRIARPLDLTEARIIASRLEADGLTTRIGAEHHISAAPFLMHALGPDVYVLSTEAQMARTILGTERAGQSDAGVVSAANPIDQCPNCESQDIARLADWIPSIFGAFIFGLPFNLGQPGRSCRDCGHAWRVARD